MDSGYIVGGIGGIHYIPPGGQVRLTGDSIGTNTMSVLEALSLEVYNWLRARARIGSGLWIERCSGAYYDRNQLYYCYCSDLIRVDFSWWRRRHWFDIELILNNDSLYLLAREVGHTSVIIGEYTSSYDEVYQVQLSDPDALDALEVQLTILTASWKLLPRKLWH